MLLDEQRIVYQKVLARVRAGVPDRRKQVFIVHGGPGTGKSVIAVNLLSDLSAEGYNSQFATGSKAFTKTLQNIVGKRASAQFKYFNNYGDASPNDVDVLINDEAHRIRETSNNRFTPKAKRRARKQLEELLDAAKVSIFLLDDRQSVRPNEIGSSGLIRKTAEFRGCEVLEYTLEAQFRCAGSAAFVNWINNTLEIERTAHTIWDQGQEAFDFQIFGSPEELEQAIRRRASLGESARLTAGYCWKWSKELKPDGSLKEDVVIGAYRRPWNARSETKGLAKGIPREVLWARDPNGINQIGCIYTAQGFEFDYVGVIWGQDLRYGFDANSWLGEKQHSHDSVVKRSGERYLDLVKNTYRVLLSRGMKGCYVCFLDKETERFVRSRTERLEVNSIRLIPEAIKPPELDREITQAEVLPFRRLARIEARHFENCVPLVDLRIAAGAFSEQQSYDEDSVEWVELSSEFKHQHGLFVAQVVGESMNRRIPNGAWCLFREIRAGTRNGKIVVAQHREISDIDTGGHFTVKVYESEKIESKDGSWTHKRIVLKPYTTVSTYEPIVIDESEAANVRIVAELVAVLD